jgi:hypothetical protein
VRKKAKLSRMKEKEEVIRKLIPKIAEKAAAITGKPVPDYELVIARIMNNMMIDDAIAPLPNGKGLKVAIQVTNYCNFGKTFTLYSAIPHNVAPVDVTPAPEKTEDGLIQWKVARIPTGEKAQLSFVLPGLDPADYDETDLYVKGIDEELVIGAEPWKGKEELPRIEVETVKTITAEGQVVEGIVERGEPPETADQEEDLEAEKELSKAASRKKEEVALAVADGRAAAARGQAPREVGKMKRVGKAFPAARIPAPGQRKLTDGAKAPKGGRK